MSDHRNKGTKSYNYVHRSDDGNPATDANGYIKFVDTDGGTYTEVDTLGSDDVTVYIEDDGTAIVGYTVHEVSLSGDNVAGATTGSTAGTSASTPDREQILNFGGSRLRVEITSNEANLVYVEVVTK